MKDKLMLNLVNMLIWKIIYNTENKILKIENRDNCKIHYIKDLEGRK